MKNFLRLFFDGCRLLLGVFSSLLAFVAMLKGEEIGLIITFVVISALCIVNNKLLLKALNKDKNYKSYSFGEKSRLNRQELNKYEGTGEILKFEYLEGDEYFTEKKVIVEYSYTFDRELYIKGYDLKSKGLKHFKFNRIFL
ncbi:MAG: hypothetical protein ACRCZO_08215 [Cetobacterium sp.]|uniref:hypothetical protein n=1 Tax=Cetobacterium sp. TaxID=2071632 RepID=UPI003F3034F1